jgi:hypothetical protein
MSNIQTSSTNHEIPHVTQLMQQQISKQDKLAEENDVRKFAKSYGLETIQKKTVDLGKS